MRFTKASNYQRVAFVPAKKSDAHTLDPQKLGLIPLNDVIVETFNGTMKQRHSDPSRPTVPAKRDATELFREQDLQMAWLQTRKPGAGLRNLGNTCFMNSVLQCLIHTPPLAELFLSDFNLHSSSSNNFDPLTLTRELLRKSLTTRGYVQPTMLAKSLKRISRSFRLGRQEDAHEYLIALLDAIHESSLAATHPKPSHEVALTSFIYRIFGGRTRSQIKCSQCSYESNTYEPFLNLSLEVTRASTVDRALEKFTEGEVLDGANKYRCSRQNSPVRAVKRMTVESPPNILVLQLKRFEYMHSGRKIDKRVEYGTSLDMAPYMSQRPATGRLVYDLYAVLVHSGHSLHSGHYVAYVKGASGNWFCCDDHHVAPVGERHVLAQKAYILFYIKRPVRETTKSSAAKQVNETKDKKRILDTQPLETSTRQKVEKARSLQVVSTPHENPSDKENEMIVRPQKSRLQAMQPKEKNKIVLKSTCMKNKIITPARTTRGRRSLRLEEQLSLASQLRRVRGRRVSSVAPPLDAHNTLDTLREQHDSDSAVSAPEWPPMKACYPEHAPAQARAMNGIGKGVQSTFSVGRGLEVENWDHLDPKQIKSKPKSVREKHDKARYDEYDAEYDRGRTKKVKSSDTNGVGTGPGAAAFDAALSRKIQQGNFPQPVQYKGKKKASQQLARGVSSRSRGRGRGRGRSNVRQRGRGRGRGRR